MPTLNVPFRARVNPWTQGAEEHMREWARAHRLVSGNAAVERLNGALIGHLAGYTYPEANSAELCTTADWTAWLFLFDDSLDDTSAGRDQDSVRHIVEALAGALTADAVEGGQRIGADLPIVLALADLLSRTAPTMPQSWRNRFVVDMTAYLCSYRTQATVNASRVALGEEEYIEHRLSSGACFAVIDLIEFANHLPLPQEIVDTEVVRRLRRTTSNVVCWTNDLFSAPKEISRGDLCNYVAVLREETGRPLETCAGMVTERICSEISAFSKAEAEFIDMTADSRTVGRNAEALDGFIRGLKTWMRGNIEWSMMTSRYQERAINSISLS